MGTVQDGTPDGPKLHSIIVDPRDPAHLYFGMSGGGVHESVDGGRHCAPLLKGLEVVEGFDAVVTGGSEADTWVRIGRNMPAEVGDIGFPLVVHPRDAVAAWVLPMDGGSVWPRTSPDGRPAVFRTRDGGDSWQRLDAGLPAAQAWWTVKRQAMSPDARDPVGLYFGTTSRELWMSGDEGDSWSCTARHLPESYAGETPRSPPGGQADGGRDPGALPRRAS